MNWCSPPLLVILVLTSFGRRALFLVSVVMGLLVSASVSVAQPTPTFPPREKAAFAEWLQVDANGSVDLGSYFCPRSPRLEPVLTAYPLDAEFSFPHLYVFSRLAQSAYKGDAAERELISQGFEDFTLLEESQTSFSAFLVRYKETAILAVAGTFDLTDAIQDLKFAQVPESTGLVPGQVHQGFQESLDGIWPRLQETLQSAPYSGLPLYLTGHSMGAAIVLLTAARLHAFRFPVRGAYAVASPRVGDPEFGQWFDRELGQQTFRVTRNLDLVPRVPPAAVDAAEFADLVPEALSDWAIRLLASNPYVHVGRVYSFEDDNPGEQPQWPTGSDFGYWKWLSGVVGKGKLLDVVWNGRNAGLHHIPDGYVCHAARQLPTGLAQGAD